MNTYLETKQLRALYGRGLAKQRDVLVEAALCDTTASTFSLHLYGDTTVSPSYLAHLGLLPFLCKLLTFFDYTEAGLKLKQPETQLIQHGINRITLFNLKRIIIISFVVSITSFHTILCNFQAASPAFLY